MGLNFNDKYINIADKIYFDEKQRGFFVVFKKIRYNIKFLHIRTTDLFYLLRWFDNAIKELNFEVIEYDEKKKEIGIILYTTN